jgi:hypothetical protein
VPVKTSYLNQLKNEIAKARGVSKEDALPIAEQTLGPLCKAAESGSLNDWLAYYQAFDNAGLKSDLPKDKIPSLSFWSGKSANNVNASEMAKQFSDSGVGARDIDQVAFNSTKDASAAFAPLSKTNQANFDHIWYELFGLQSSLYATLARGDVICFMPMGLSIGNIFWKNELPVLRRLQQMGAVDHVYVYTDDKTPTGFKDDDKDEDMRRQLWFNKSVELTSASVSMSKRQGDGTWLKLGVNADIFVKWLLGAPESSRSLPYWCRQLALIYARLLQGDKNAEFIVEMWKPYVSDDVKRLIVRGYQTDKDVLHRVSILEKFLFANFPDWSRLPLWPDHLLYVEDCILHAKGARNVLLALLHDGTWIYAEHIAKRLEELPESTVKALLEGKPNETPTELSFRLASLHSAIAGPRHSANCRDYRRQSCRPAPAIRRLTRKGELLVYMEIPVPFQQRARLAL